MMQALNAFRFRRGATLLHRLNPITKMILEVGVLIMALAFTDPVVLSMIFAAVMPLVFVAGGFRNWLRTMKGAIFLALFLLALNTWFVSFQFAVAMVVRLLILLSAFSVFFLTTHPEDLSLALTKIRIPYDYALAFTMAIRFVPTLAKESHDIIEAQKSRGLELERGRFWKRFKNYLPILVPLILTSFRRADMVAAAMESRAFGARERRTFYRQLGFGYLDSIVITLTVLTAALAIYASILGIPAVTLG